MGMVGTISGTITGTGGYENVASGNPILTPDDSILPSGAKRKKDSEEVDEGMKEYIQVALIASMLAVPGFISADEIGKRIPNKATATEIQDALKSVSEQSMYGGYTLLQAVNIITRTLYAEAKGEPLEGKEMVATVIWNRSGGNLDKLVQVCFKKSQFSAWNKADRAILTPQAYSIKVSAEAVNNPISKRAWNECQEIASSMFNGSFSPLGKQNAYLNPAKANKTALTTWGTTMTDKVVIGKHRFGYVADQDPDNKASNKVSNIAQTHKVAPKETISKIAQKLIASGKSAYTDVKQLVAKIVELNHLPNNGNVIHVGQVLILPESTEKNV